MRKTSGADTSPRISRTSSSTLARVTPAASARWVARWITGPSASGSENGMPSSMTSAPRRAASTTSFRVIASDGSPAVK